MDFVKFIVEGTSCIRGNSLLNFEFKVNDKTGEPNSYMEAEYSGLKFVLFGNGLLKVTGSLHKYWNRERGLHNYDDFTFCDLIWVLFELSETFGFDLRCCKLQNIEFGVNFKPYGSTLAILYNLLHHDTKRFDSRFKGHFRYVTHCQYIVKVYDKGKQYNLPYPLLRFELKFTKMAKVNHIGVFTLADLTTSSWADAAYNMLAKAWNEILLFDGSISLETLKPKEREIKYHQWANPLYWLSLNKHKRRREKKDYLSLITRSSDKVHFHNGQLISEKWIYLQNN